MLSQKMFFMAFYYYLHFKERKNYIQYILYTDQYSIIQAVKSTCIM